MPENITDLITEYLADHQSEAEALIRKSKGWAEEKAKIAKAKTAVAELLAKRAYLKLQAEADNAEIKALSKKINLMRGRVLCISKKLKHLEPLIDTAFAELRALKANG